MTIKLPDTPRTLPYHIRCQLVRFDDAQANDCMAPCKHGHINCSYKSGGPCFDELLANYPAAADFCAANEIQESSGEDQLSQAESFNDVQ